MKSKMKSFFIIAFCTVILLMCLYIQYLLQQQTKINFIEMTEVQSSMKEEYDAQMSEEAENAGADSSQVDSGESEGNAE